MTESPFDAVLRRRMRAAVSDMAPAPDLALRARATAERRRRRTRAGWGSAAAVGSAATFAVAVLTGPGVPALQVRTVAVPPSSVVASGTDDATRGTFVPFRSADDPANGTLPFAVTPEGRRSWQPQVVVGRWSLTLLPAGLVGYGEVEVEGGALRQRFGPDVRGESRDGDRGERARAMSLTVIPAGDGDVRALVESRTRRLATAAAAAGARDGTTVPGPVPGRVAGRPASYVPGAGAGPASLVFVLERDGRADLLELTGEGLRAGELMDVVRHVRPRTGSEVADTDLDGEGGVITS